MPTYTANTRTLTAKPRSKRMQQGAIATAQVVQGGGSVQGNYLPATNNGDGYDVADKVAFLQKIRIGAPDTIVDGVVTQVNGIDIEIDTSNGAVHVKGGLYADGFISALGLNPDAPTPGGGGLDEDELWTILGGSSTNHHILPTYLDSVPWASLTGKPSWIGSSKPSYAFNEISGTVTNAQLAGSIANAKLANSSVTIAGVSVSLGGSITQTSLRTALGLGSNAYTSTAYLPTGGGTMTGNLVISESKNILLRTANTSYTAGIGYDTTGNECIALWAKNSVTRLRWYAGVDMTNLTPGTMMNITPDFELSKADGTAKGYISGYRILDASNYSSYAIPLNGTLAYTHTNEINFRGGPQQVCWFNYRNADTGVNTSGVTVRYKFACYNYDTVSNSEIVAGKMAVGLNHNSTIQGTLHVYQSAWDNGLFLQRSSANAGACIKILDGAGTSLGNFGINGSGHMEIMPNNNVGIGTSLPTSKLHVVGGIYATGAITAGASSSDKRLKKDIKQFNAMSIVDALKPVQFRWNNVAKGLDKYFDTDEIQYGLIAQECDKAMPGLAFKFKANDYYGVRYEKLIPVLLEAIKELKQEINQLKKRV